MHAQNAWFYVMVVSFFEKQDVRSSRARLVQTELSAILTAGYPPVLSPSGCNASS
jgi:hypothetical protein